MDKKKIICAALISVMALSLAACGNKKVDYGMKAVKRSRFGMRRFGMRSF